MSGLTNDSGEWLFQQGIIVKWEYLVIKIKSDADLDKHGNAGWELVDIDRNPDRVEGIFKRRKA